MYSVPVMTDSGAFDVAVKGSDYPDIHSQSPPNPTSRRDRNHSHRISYKLWNQNLGRDGGPCRQRRPQHSKFRVQARRPSTGILCHNLLLCRRLRPFEKTLYFHRRGLEHMGRSWTQKAGLRHPTHCPIPRLQSRCWARHMGFQRRAQGLYLLTAFQIGTAELIAISPPSQSPPSTPPSSPAPQSNLRPRPPISMKPWSPSGASFPAALPPFPQPLAPPATSMCATSPPCTSGQLNTPSKQTGNGT